MKFLDCKSPFKNGKTKTCELKNRNRHMINQKFHNFFKQYDLGIYNENFLLAYHSVFSIYFLYAQEPIHFVTAMLYWFFEYQEKNLR